MKHVEEAKPGKDARDSGPDAGTSGRNGSDGLPEVVVRQAPGEQPLKEVIAIVRPRMATATKVELQKAGIPTLTAMRVVGRGRQGGLAYPGPGTARVHYLPKCLLMLAVPEGDVERAIAAIVRANRTGEIGDGKIFVAPLGDARRIRTGERSAEAIRC